MKAALFEMESWMGTEEYIFEGASASEMLSKFENVQDLGCLVRMGSREERSAAGKKAIRDLEALLDKHYSGELTDADLLSLDIKISIGAIKCSAIVEGEEAIADLRTAHPKAKSR